MYMSAGKVRDSLEVSVEVSSQDDVQKRWVVCAQPNLWNVYSPRMRDDKLAPPFFGAHLFGVRQTDENNRYIIYV